MAKILTAIFGANNRNTTVAGIGALLVVVGSLLSTGPGGGARVSGARESGGA